MTEDNKKNATVDNDGWTPVWEGMPKKADLYLVTRIKPRRTTMAFYEDGKWWSDPLHTDFWPSYMIIAWKPRPAPFAGIPVTFVPDVDLKAAADVFEVLGLKPRKKNGKYQLDEVYDCYSSIGNWYDDFKRLAVAKKWVRAFDRALPEHKGIGATKKIDFILWAAGSNQNKDKA